MNIASSAKKWDIVLRSVKGRGWSIAKNATKMGMWLVNAPAIFKVPATDVNNMDIEHKTAKMNPLCRKS